MSEDRHLGCGNSDEPAASASPSTSALKNLSILEKQILRDKLKDDITDIQTQISNVDKMLVEVRQVSAVTNERGKLAEEVKSFNSAAATLRDVNNLKQEIESLKKELAVRTQTEVQVGGHSKRQEMGHDKFLEIMAKCSELEDVVNAKKKALSYTAVLPPDLEGIKACIETRKEYFKLLQDKVDAKISEENK